MGEVGELSPHSGKIKNLFKKMKERLRGINLDTNKREVLLDKLRPEIVEFIKTGRLYEFILDPKHAKVHNLPDSFEGAMERSEKIRGRVMKGFLAGNECVIYAVAHTMARRTGEALDSLRASSLSEGKTVDYLETEKALLEKEDSLHALADTFLDEEQRKNEEFPPVSSINWEKVLAQPEDRKIKLDKLKNLGKFELTEPVDNRRN